MRFVVALLVSCLVPVAACRPKTTGPGLDDRVFLSQSITEDGSPRALVGTDHARLHFYESPRVTASVGCNSMETQYSIADGRFETGNQAITAIGCDAERHEQDDWYFGFLGSSPAITVDGDSLVLEGEGTRIEYLDQEVATPDLDLVGPLWTVDTIVDGQVASHAAWPEPATMRFGSGGEMEFYTGCNSGSAQYRLEGSTMVFESFSVTERGCVDAGTQDLESAVLGLVGSTQPVTWEITVDLLRLRNADGGVDLRGSNRPASPIEDGREHHD